jgi:hypothetical protein
MVAKCDEMAATGAVGNGIWDTSKYYGYRFLTLFSYEHHQRLQRLVLIGTMTCFSFLNGGASILFMLAAAASFQAPAASAFQISLCMQCASQYRNARRGLTLAASDLSTKPVVEVESNKAHQANHDPSPPTYAHSEIFVANALLHEDLNDEKLWVPQTETVSFRPLCLSVSGGYYVNLLRVRGSGMLSRHRHPGPVHGYVLKGKWRYLEHDWVAVEGSYIFEPPGEIHTLVVPDDVDEMITLFFVTGSLLYCDESGNVVGADDVFTKLNMVRKHYLSLGLGEDFIKQFVR